MPVVFFHDKHLSKLGSHGHEANMRRIGKQSSFARRLDDILVRARSTKEADAESWPVVNGASSADIYCSKDDRQNNETKE